MLGDVIALAGGVLAGDLDAASLSAATRPAGAPQPQWPADTSDFDPPDDFR